MLLVRNENGKIIKYRVETPKMKAKRESKAKQKPKPKQLEHGEKTKCEILAESMKPCFVLVPILTVEDITKIRMVVHREYMITTVKTKIVTLPGTLKLISQL